MFFANVYSKHNDCATKGGGEGSAEQPLDNSRNSTFREFFIFVRSIRFNFLHSKKSWFHLGLLIPLLARSNSQK